MDTIFSHRPIAGVSVGARKVGDTLIVAVALVNDGTSRNGLFWADRCDNFCRATARAIINGRIDHAAARTHSSFFERKYKTDLSAREFMSRFRKVFKPTVDESDDVLVNTATFHGLDHYIFPEKGDFNEAELRFRPTVTEIVSRIFSLTTGVINNASTSV